MKNKRVVLRSNFSSVSKPDNMKKFLGDVFDFSDDEGVLCVKVHIQRADNTYDSFIYPMNISDRMTKSDFISRSIEFTTTIHEEVIQIQYSEDPVVHLQYDSISPLLHKCKILS